MSLNKGFPYLPLTSPTQIRLIILSPGEDDDPIYCSQWVTDLDFDCRLPVEARPHETYPAQCTASSTDTCAPHIEVQSVTTLGPQMEEAGRCKIHTFQNYTALSYVWGDQSSPHKILIDGKPFNVGENLYFALLRLRQKMDLASIGEIAPEDRHDPKFEALRHLTSSRHRFLWVDAICINQNDIAEREAQVKIMSRIYEQADHVHGDLGHKSMTGGQELLHLLQSILRAGRLCERYTSSSNKGFRQALYSEAEAHADLSSALATEYENFEAGTPTNTHQVLLPDPSAHVLEKQGIPEEDDIMWTHWRQFLNSTYFQRLWIVQEVSLAKSITLWYSNVSMELEMVAECLQHLEEYSTNLTLYSLSKDDLTTSTLTKESNLWAVKGLIRERQQLHRVSSHITKTVPLLNMLDVSRRKKATDLRDKIFGLLSMAVDGSDFLHLVTYSRSTESVYQDFAKCFIERGQGISMLYQVDSRVSQTLDIPSWVPDWSREKNEQSLYLEAPSTPGFPGDQKVPDLRCLGSKLVIRGHVIDTVKCLTTIAPGNGTYAAFHEIAAFLWHGGNLILKQNPEQGQPMEILLQTLLCGSLNTMSTTEAEKLRQGITAFFGHGTYLINRGKSEDSPWLPHIRHFMRRGLNLALGRRWCITENGKFGLVPGSTREGDRVALLGGQSLPFILRDCSASDNALTESMDKAISQNIAAAALAGSSTKTTTTYALLGHGYVHELDATEIHNRGGNNAKEIILV